MKYVARNGFLILVAAALIAGCGGGGGGADATPPTTLTGVFLDSAVIGVQYATKNSTGATTHSGATNAKGEFQYQSGDTVTFSIGALAFPKATVPAAGTVTPMTLSLGGTDITTDQQATNIARLLQSLDANGNPNDGITIPAGAATAATTAVDFNVDTATFGSNPVVTNLVANSGSITTTLVSAVAAQAHVAATMSNRIVGAWRHTGSGGAFSYLVLFSNNTFSYGEYAPNTQEPALENGLEVGTYSYDAMTGKITFNITYDDNTSSNPVGSGLGKIGTPAVIDTALSNGDKTLTIMGGVLVSVNFDLSPISGVWRATRADGAFSILMLTDDGVFTYAEYAPNTLEPELENGLEVGTYSYDATTGKITLDVTYDDNTSTNPVGSGLGKIGTPAVIDAALSNGGNTLTINGGVLMLTREF